MGKRYTWSAWSWGVGELLTTEACKILRKLYCMFCFCWMESLWICYRSLHLEKGHLFMCGDNSFGQLGTGDNQSYNLPVEVLFFASKHVEQIACGMRHTLALVTGDLVYGFGSARHGQIGNFVSKSQKSCNLPEVIQGFGSCKIVGLFANGDHSAAVTDYLTDGEVYMLGGYRHWAVSGSRVVNPVQHQSVPSAPCTTISDVRMLEKVSCLDGERVVQIAAGAEHSALLTERGKIMTWGWGEHGQLGLGNTHDQTFPQLVNVPNQRSSAATRGIYCGSGFTIVKTST